MFVKYGLLPVALLTLQWLSCFPVDPDADRLTGSPVLSCGGLTPLPDAVDGYHVSVHLSWTFDKDGEQPVYSYTILRKLPSDSVFEVFSRSREIPADTFNFYDDLENLTYPLSGFDSIQYRMYAVNKKGYSSDTSAECLIFLAPQPVFNSFDASTRCLEWESWIRGGITSWCVVWSDEAGRSWTSPQRDEFPFTDEPALFSACLPDSLGTPGDDRWFYALYLRSNEANSLTIGEIDVP